MSQNLILSRLWRELPESRKRLYGDPRAQPTSPETYVWNPAKASLDLVWSLVKVIWAGEFCNPQASAS